MRTCALILIVLAGLGLRLGQAWQGTDHNLDDSAAYERIARGLARGLMYTQSGELAVSVVQEGLIRKVR